MKKKKLLLETLQMCKFVNISKHISKSLENIYF